ncbi:uncharacterized protein LOC128257132 [Drosophila gunungcola]|uniref:uncharacterized protein LOC128257132 n=1 Tax=Drosophila gunungcola TaxID=103775 RepID=UPI0022E67740|nr:uncharacterized protein LOC128257132 [Drosophila gunungcola]
MNIIQGCVLVFLGLVLTAVDAQTPVRNETSKDRACGPGRYYNEFRRTCLPW